MKIELVRNGKLEKVGEIHIVGKLPKSKPYVWIGFYNAPIAVIDTRQMNALVNRWKKANKTK